MNTEHLKKVAAAIKTGHEMMGSKWQNCEAEVIALQTVSACALNLKNKDDAFSWLAGSCTTGRQQCGTNNARGLQMLLDDGSLIQESYTGKHKAPSETATHDGKPQILRVSQHLLKYVASQMKVTL